VVVAADAAVLDKAVRQIGTAVRTMAVDQTERAAHILVEHEVFAEQTQRLDRDRLELAHARDRHPVPAQQVAHRGARADLGQQAILLGS
jgi:hypothetical protein